MDERIVPKEVCISLPPAVNSDGAWTNMTAPLTEFSLPLLQTQMVAIFATTQISHLVFRNFGIPKFVSEMIVCLLIREINYFLF